MTTSRLKELRKFGVATICCDQSAHEVISDVLINCSTQVFHRVLYGEDKKALGEAIGLSELERTYLSYLELGDALIFHPEAYSPIHTTIDDWRSGA